MVNRFLKKMSRETYYVIPSRIVGESSKILGIHADLHALEIVEDSRWSREVERGKKKNGSFSANWSRSYLEEVEDTGAPFLSIWTSRPFKNRLSQWNRLTHCTVKPSLDSFFFFIPCSSIQTAFTNNFSILGVRNILCFLIRRIVLNCSHRLDLFDFLFTFLFRGNWQYRNYT